MNFYSIIRHELVLILINSGCSYIIAKRILKPHTIEYQFKSQDLIKLQIRLSELDSKDLEWAMELNDCISQYFDNSSKSTKLLDLTIIENFKFV